MQTFQGRVTEVQERQGKSARGPWTLYTIVLATDSGEQKIGAGFDKPSVSPNQAISINAAQNSRGYLEADMKTLQVLADDQVSTSVPTVKQAAASGDDRQRSIVTQTSYKVAVEAVETLMSQGVLSIKGGTTQATQQKGLDAYLSVLDRVAQHVFNRSMNPFTVTEEDEGELEDDGSFNPLG